MTSSGENVVPLRPSQAPPDVAPEVFARVDRLGAEFERQSDVAAAPNRDPQEAACSAAFAELMSLQGFRNEIIAAYQVRYETRRPRSEPVMPTMDANQARIAVRRNARRMPDYPFLTINEYSATIEKTVLHPYYYGQFIMDICEPTVTNTPQRASAAKLVIQSVAARFDEPMLNADFASSMMLGVKPLFLSGRGGYQFESASFYQRKTNGRFVEPDAEATVAANEILNCRTLPDDMTFICSDVWDVREDAGKKELALISSLRPHEYVSGAEETLLHLIDTDVPGISFEMYDLLSRTPEGLTAMLDGQKLSIATISTALYMFTPREQKRIIDNLLPNMRPDGFIVVSDHAWRDNRLSVGLRFPRRWNSYNTFVLDMANLQAGWQHVLEASSSRPKEFICKTGMIAVRPEADPQSFRDLLLAA